MIGDYSTKPSQGSLFWKFRNLIIGKEEEDITKHNTKAQKCIKEKKWENSNLTNSIKAGGLNQRSVLESKNKYVILIHTSEQNNS